jgi:GTP cyclohydrolase I
MELNASARTSISSDVWTFSFTTFANAAGYDELVLALDIPFVSLCTHHLLPLTRPAHVAYVPGPRIVGPSKLAPSGAPLRAVPPGRGATYQTRGDLIQRELEPKGVAW